MKKLFFKTLLLAAVLLASASVSEARIIRDRNLLYGEGYAGNVALDVSMLSLGAELTTSHGYSFGNGLFMGFGLGAGINYSHQDIYMPIYIDSKYSFINKRYSPFVALRGGTVLSYTYDAGYFVAPSVGIDMGRMSLFMRYTFKQHFTQAHVTATNAFGYTVYDGYVPAKVSMHMLSIGVAVNF